MPNLAVELQALAATEGDWRAFRGATLFSRGGTSVTAPASWPRFEDVLQALTGYTSQAGADLGADANAGWTGGASVITAGITGADLVYVHSSAVAFTLAASDSAWGLPTSPTASSPTGGAGPYGAGHVVLGTADWTRGKRPFGSGAGTVLTITPSGGGAAYASPSYVGAVASLPILLRKAAIGDADAARVADCLEALDNAALGVTSLRWGINDTGHVFTTRPSAVAARPSFGNTAFRDALGFDGSETEVASGSLRTLTAARLPPSLVLPFGLQRCHPWTDEAGEYVDLRDGSIAGQEMQATSGWEVDLYVQGPAMGDADETHHVFGRFLPLARRARGLNLYRGWGDSRRWLSPYAVTASQLAYDLLYTSQPDTGRLRCVRDSGDESRRRPAYLGQPEVVSTLSFMLRNRVD